MTELHDLVMLLGMVVVAAFVGGLVLAMLSLLWEAWKRD